ncbi:aldehyde dehydrogenase family protein [Priestia koreensis]|uniref:Aldehyde dehydrogenase n=1 Tax=Priestia koreensis TaxID=284581 RepID=A0A0M0L5G6_9BACI|nr:aldehyde dehydrogenase family protein [Priestia koreensis]KOO46316.1 hypothetical protein AMD01_10735 [Priestia koreensis]
MSVNNDQSTAEIMMKRARQAHTGWKMSTLATRLRYVKKLRERLLKDIDEWVEAIHEATFRHKVDILTGDVLATIDALSYYEKNAEAMLAPKKRSTPLTFWGNHSYIQYDSLGVVLLFAPWNYPLQLSILPLISAFITGNTIILKMSERLPKIAEKVATLLSELGLPEGVIQVTWGDKGIGEQLIEQGPNKIFFTGSEGVGKEILKRAAPLLIPCDLELSGKDPMIVLADANIERAARAAVWGSFMNSGQVCVSIERVYVHESILATFVEKVKTYTEEMEEFMGGMTTIEGFNEALRQVRQALDQGAKLVCGTLDQLYPHWSPVVLTNANHTMTIMKSETFAPVMPIMTFSTVEEAIRLANDSKYGLNASIFTRNIKAAEDIVFALETGNCFINDVVRNISNMHLPFGGSKKSGFGRYHGPEGLYTFCNVKAIMSGKGSRNREMNWYPYKKDTISILSTYMKWFHR